MLWSTSNVGPQGRGLTLYVFTLIFFNTASLAIATQAATTVIDGSAPLDDIKLPPSVPAKIKLTDRPADPNGKLVKVRYGPITLPPNSVVAVLPEEVGGIKIPKPCDECFLGAFQGNLEYEDGTEANVDTGPYLHHSVVVNNNKPDWLCGLRIGALIRAQYVYNSGNERPPVRLNSKRKFGMRVDKADTFSLALELMNMSNETRVVYSTVIYEVIPINTPGYQEATHLRIDVWQCGASDVPAGKGVYTYTSPKFISPYSGEILHTDGHGHDGTTEVNLKINGKMSCRSIQYYGLRNTAVQPHHIAVQHGDSHAAMQYISDAGACEDYGRIDKGDEIWTEAFYNATMYPQMVFKGHVEGQMGIHFLYIGRDDHTLNDRLPADPRSDELPLEMGYRSVMSLPRNQTSSAPLNFTDLLAAYQLPPNTDLGKILPELPKGFSVSDPFLNTPMGPPYLNASFNVSSLQWPGARGSGPPYAGFNMSDPLYKAILDLFNGVLKSCVPSVPKDFKLSNIITQGGIVVSEMDVLEDAIYESYFKGYPKGLESWGLPPKGESPTGPPKTGSPTQPVKGDPNPWSLGPLGDLLIKNCFTPPSTPNSPVAKSGGPVVRGVAIDADPKAVFHPLFTALERHRSHIQPRKHLARRYQVLVT